MTTLLPVGAYVRVTEADHTYVAKVAGYDDFHSKYSLGARYAGWGRWLFTDRGWWAFLSQVEEITESEALA